MAGEPTINPYAPPASDVGGAVGGAPVATFLRPMFSPRQVGWAAFFGSLFAGILLMQANFRTMGRPAAANKTVALGLLIGVALIALLSVAPKGVSTPLNVATGWAVYKIALSLQGDAFFKHGIAGGARHSNWLVFGVIVATVVGLLAVFFGVGYSIVRLGRID
jgi:hypothetical protein